MHEEALEHKVEVDVGHRRYHREYVGEGYEVMPAFIGEKAASKASHSACTQQRTLSMRAASSANSYDMSFIDIPAVTAFIEASCIIGGVKRDIVGKSMRPSRVHFRR